MTEFVPEPTTLVRRARSGDSAALDELLAELRPLIVRTARLIVGAGSSAAEDVAQEAMLDLSRGIGTLRDPAAVRGWALRLTTRRAIRAARKEHLLRRRSTALVEQLEAGAPVIGRTDALKAAFDRLPARLRATAVLRLLAGLSEEETAAVLRCSIGTVKSNLHDARRQLTQMLIEAGYAPAVEREEGS